MANITKIKEQSPLVKAVLALDNGFSELGRLGSQINALEMKSEFDFEHAERLMKRFAETGEAISTEVGQLSTHLNEARTRAEEVAKGVAARAELLGARKEERQKKSDDLQRLAEKVRELNMAMTSLRRPEGETLSEQDRSNMLESLGQFESQMIPLIEQAQNLRADAREAKMKFLEQNAESLAQTLQAARQKILNVQAQPAPQSELKSESLQPSQNPSTEKPIEI
jgi:chromosome segregation ATPase